MLSSVEQACVGREEIRAPLKTPAWEAKPQAAHTICMSNRHAGSLRDRRQKGKGKGEFGGVRARGQLVWSGKEAR